jgi:SAM-dependent methyltransferase
LRVFPAKKLMPTVTTSRLNQDNESVLLQNIRRETIRRLRILEALPPKGNGTSAGNRQWRYPVERDLAAYQRKLPELSSALKATPINAVGLDLGAGSGIALNEIRKKYGHTVLGTGIQYATRPDFPMLLAVAAFLPFKSGAFDFVLSVHGISWEPNQVRAIAEVNRVLRPGGWALISIHPFTYAMSVYFKSFWDDIGVSIEKYRALGAEFDVAKAGTHKGIVRRRESNAGEELRKPRPFTILIKKPGRCGSKSSK